VLSKTVGHLDIAAARLLMDKTDQVPAAQGPYHAFNDWQEMTGYDSDARTTFVPSVGGPTRSPSTSS